MINNIQTTKKRSRTQSNKRILWNQKIVKSNYKRQSQLCSFELCRNNGQNGYSKFPPFFGSLGGYGWQIWENFCYHKNAIIPCLIITLYYLPICKQTETNFPVLNLVEFYFKNQCPKSVGGLDHSLENILLSFAKKNPSSFSSCILISPARNALGRRQLKCQQNGVFLFDWHTPFF